MWCSVASPLPANKGKAELLRLPLIYLLRLCFQRTFIQLLATLKLQTEFCSFYTQGSVTAQSHLTAAHSNTQQISEHPH